MEECSYLESQRDSATKPRVARNELPWVRWPENFRDYPGSTSHKIILPRLISAPKSDVGESNEEGRNEVEIHVECDEVLMQSLQREATQGH